MTIWPYFSRNLIVSKKLFNVGKIRTALEKTGQCGKEPDNFLGPDCPVLSNPPVCRKNYKVQNDCKLVKWCDLKLLSISNLIFAPQVGQRLRRRTFVRSFLCCSLVRFVQ